MLSNKVMLGWSSIEFYVSDEGLERIKTVIAENQICPKCKNRIDDLRLLVGKRCIECVVMETGLTLIGLKEVNKDGYRVYEFTDDKGISFTSTENRSDTPQEDTALSIEKAGFTVPASYKPFKATEQVDLDRSYWKIYGKLTNSVVILHYRDYYGKVTADFVAYKHGNTIEFNRRTTEHKTMLEKARSLAMRTKRDRNYYIDGEATEVLYDNHLLTIISQLESVMYDAQLELFGPTDQAQEETPVAIPPEKKPRKRGNLELVAPAEEPAPEEATE